VENNWIVLLIRDKYNTKNEKERVFNEIKKKYNLSDNDIYSVDKECNLSLSFYVFVKKTKNIDMNNIAFEFNNYFDNRGTAIITDDELLNMTRGITTYRGYIKFGDIVLIRSGIYKKLYGVVVRKSDKNMLSVVIKLCFATLCVEYKESEIEVIGNIFKYIKINQ